MSSFEYRLQRIPQGVVILDAARRVISANRLARGLLEGRGLAVIGAAILDLHPEAARPKVSWLLDSAQGQPDGTAAMAMTLPMGTLVAKVSLLEDDRDGGGRYCMVFHLVDALPATPQAPLVKLPIDSRQGVRLLGVEDAVALRADGHYSRVFAADGAEYPCTMALRELSERLDGAAFLQVHRSWIVHLRHASAVERGPGHWHIILNSPGLARVPVSRSRVDELRRRLAL